MGEVINVIVRIDGHEYDLDDCLWVCVAPCGCIEGLMSTRRKGCLLLATDDVAAGYYENAAEERWSRERGFRFELALASVRTAITDCAHDPKWGIEPSPESPDMAWAEAGSRPRIRHLVPAGAVREPGQAAGVDVQRATARCGAGGMRYWRTSRLAPGFTDCKNCSRLVKGVDQ